MEYLLLSVALLVCVMYGVLIATSEKKDQPTIGALFAVNLVVFAVMYYVIHSSCQAEIQDWEGLLKL
jgi:uncharacterized membrane protein